MQHMGGIKRKWRWEIKVEEKLEGREKCKGHQQLCEF